MVEQYILTQAGVLTLLMTSSPFLLLTLSPTLLHARASSLPSEPRCKFPKFLQTRRNKQWMMNQSNALATFDVHGGKIFARHGACIRSRDYSRQRQSGMAECTKLNYTQVCLEKRPGNKYLVRHVESDFDDKYVCVEFLKRGISVVQVKMSLIQGKQFVTHLCDDRYMHVGPWPWISEEHYRSPPVRCPFTGGYNLRLKYASPPPKSKSKFIGRNSYYGSKTYYGPSYYSRVSSDISTNDCVDSTTAPIRMESDCVAGEGIVFNFKHQSCLPADTNMALHQRTLCMATWRSGLELFAMLRADNNDRAFFCLRVSLSQEDRGPRDMRTSAEMGSIKIEEVMLFLGWVCPTSSYADSARSSSGTGSSVSPLSTPHMALTVQDQQIITEPCSDQITLCHNHTSFCKHLYCMRTCEQCAEAETMGESASFSFMSKKATILASDRFAVRYTKQREENGLVLAGEAGGESVNQARHLGHSPHLRTRQQHFKQKCTFPQGIRGTWLRRISNGNDEKIVITDSTLNHPRLGILECVTFARPGSMSAPLQRVMWSRYKNGCYPRFTCLHFNTPAKSVMRYRLADMQLWPLELSDDSICDQKHFMEPPDMYKPGEKYTMRSWEVIRRSGHIHKLACILPHYIPRVVSFLDNRGRSGCLVHATYYSPRDISLTFFPKPFSSKPGSSGRNHARPEHAETYDVSGENGDVEHRKSVYDLGNNNYGVSGKKKFKLIPSTDDKARGFGYDHKGLWIPDHHPVTPRHDRTHHKLGRSEDDQWSENWHENYHPNIYDHYDQYPEDTDDQGWDKPKLYKKNNWTNNEYDLNSLKSYTTNININSKSHLIVDLQNNYHRNIDQGNAYGEEDRQTARHDSLDKNYRYVHRYRKSSGHRSTIRVKVTYQCLAVMTYVDSYKSLLTVTSENPEEILCWLVINATTVIIVKTSSCNSPTARQILATPSHSLLHKEHVHNILHLQQGQRNCSAAYPADPVRPEPIEFREDDGSGAKALSLLGHDELLNLFVSWCALTVAISFLHR